MCGRYNLSGFIAFEELMELLSDKRLTGGQVKTSGEVFPGDCVPVLARNRQLQQKAFAMRWGYTLQQQKGLIINARSETAAEKSLFRQSMTHRRCLIPATDYFEWETRGKERIKYSISPLRSGGFYLAGIYRMEQDAPRFVILTREPADNIRFIHDRMPVLLPVELKNDWLDPRCEAGELLRACVSDVAYRRVSGGEQMQLKLEEEA